MKAPLVSNERLTPMVRGHVPFQRLFRFGLIGFSLAIYLAWREYRPVDQSTAQQDAVILSLERKPKNRIEPIRLGIYGGESDMDKKSMDLARIFRTVPGEIRWEVLKASQFQSDVLQQYDAVIFPGGRATEQARSLGEMGKQAVREFVRDGGGYVGICAGGFLACSEFDWSLGLLNAKVLTGNIYDPERGMIPMASRGSGNVEIKLTNSGQIIFGNLRHSLNVRYTSGPVLSPGGKRDLPEYVSLAHFRSEISEHSSQLGTMIDTPAILAAPYGLGRVVVFSPHPEVTEGLETMVIRAVFWVARNSP